MKKILTLMLVLAVCVSAFAFACAEPVEVELWHYFDSSNDKDMINKWVDDYNALQDKIHITSTYVSRQELMNQYAIGAISGELPDIGMVDSPDMASFISLGSITALYEARKRHPKRREYRDVRKPQIAQTAIKSFRSPIPISCRAPMKNQTARDSMRSGRCFIDVTEHRIRPAMIAGYVTLL